MGRELDEFAAAVLCCCHSFPFTLLEKRKGELINFLLSGISTADFLSMQHPLTYLPPYIPKEFNIISQRVYLSVYLSVHPSVHPSVW